MVKRKKNSARFYRVYSPSGDDCPFNFAKLPEARQRFRQLVKTDPYSEWRLLSANKTNPSDYTVLESYSPPQTDHEDLYGSGYEDYETDEGNLSFAY